MKKIKINLHLQTLEDGLKEIPIQDLPVVFSGNANECQNYAWQNGFKWKKDTNLFGGYYYKNNITLLLV